MPYRANLEAIRTGDRTLLNRNAILNVAGSVVPLTFGLLAIPVLIRTLGTDRFGLLALIWVLIGYLALFDFGVGRAITHRVSALLGEDEGEALGTTLWTGLLIATAMGTAGGVAFFLAVPWLVGRVLAVPPELVDEGVASFRLLAVGLPFVVGGTAARGYLEGLQRFGRVNAVRLPLGALAFAGPMAVLPFSTHLVPIVAVLVAGRAAALATWLVMAARLVPTGGPRRLDPGEGRRLMAYGGWLTLSNVVSPVMVYFDRFLIGAVLGLSAVAYYATPYEVVTKLLVIPVALTSVLFPAFASTLRSRAERAAVLFRDLNGAILVTIGPAILVLFTLAPEGLELWVGESFATAGAPVARWLLVGVLFNALAQTPFALIQSAGRPDLTARIHVIEAPFYLVLLWYALHGWGIVGAALAWSVRTAIDCGVLFLVADRLLPEGSEGARLAAWSGGVLTLCAVSLALATTTAKLVFLAVALIPFTLLAGRAARRWMRDVDEIEQEPLEGLAAS